MSSAADLAVLWSTRNSSGFTNEWMKETCRDTCAINIHIGFSGGGGSIDIWTTLKYVDDDILIHLFKDPASHGEDGENLF